MTSVLVLRIAILACVFLGGLFAIIAVAGREWQKKEVQDGLITKKATIGLWEACVFLTGDPTQCSTFKLKPGSLKGRLMYLQKDQLTSYLCFGHTMLLQIIVLIIFWTVNNMDTFVDFLQRQFILILFMHFLHRKDNSGKKKKISCKSSFM